MRWVKKVRFTDGEMVGWGPVLQEHLALEIQTRRGAMGSEEGERVMVRRLTGWDCAGLTWRLWLC